MTKPMPMPLVPIDESELKPRKPRIVKCGNKACGAEFDANALNRWLGKYCCNLCSAIADRDRTIERKNTEVMNLYQYYLGHPDTRTLPEVYKDKAP